MKPDKVAGLCLEQELGTLRRQVARLRQMVKQREQLIRRCENHQASASSLLNEKRFQDIATNFPGAIFQFTSRDGVWNVDYISDRLFDLAGITAVEMMRDFNQFIERVHPSDLNSYIQSVVQAVETITPWHYEGRLVKPDGQIRWWQGRSTPSKNERGEIIFCGVLLDITARKQAEIALQQSEESLRQLNEVLETRVEERTAQLHRKTSELQAILEAFPDLFFHLAPDSTILDYKVGDRSSPNCHQLSTLCLGQRMIDLVPEEVGTKIAQALATVDKTQSLVSIEYSLPRSTGEEYYEGRFLPLDRDRTILIVRNISDRKQAEIKLRKQATDLEQMLHELQQTQSQLVHNEKMSSLGQLVAGVAHEINNPVNFIHGNLMHTAEYANSLLQIIQAYQECYPHPHPQLVDLLEEVEFDFLVEDFPKVINSMQVGAQRIREIITSLRNFSRLDEAEVKTVNVHDGIDSTLMILQNRLKAKPNQAEIWVVKNYGDLPLVGCYPGQLNQVFMNILANAIDALEERDRHRPFPDIKQNPSSIFITTEAIASTSQVKISIRDNGPGIPETVKNRIFDPFFTTKGVGKGTGLGMSISYQIVTEKHKGSLECLSPEGKGAEFVIQIPMSQASL